MKKQSRQNGWALLTGASRGIGLELARGLSQRGYRLVIVARNEGQLAHAREELLACGAEEVVALPLDLTAEGAPQRLYDECLARGLEVEVLVNNAGMFIYRDVCELEPERVERILALHIGATTELCHLFVRDMCARGRGWMLNMSSYASWLPLAGLGMYSATKAYIRDFSYALAEEVRERGVRVCVALPAGVATDLYGLPRRYQRLGLRCGVLLSPQKVAKKSLLDLFRGRRRSIAGVLNRLFLPIARHLPRCAKRTLRRKTMSLQR